MDSLCIHLWHFNEKFATQPRRGSKRLKIANLISVTQCVAVSVCQSVPACACVNLYMPVCVCIARVCVSTLPHVAHTDQTAR